MRSLFTPTAIVSAALLAMASSASAQVPTAAAPAAGPEVAGAIEVDKIDFTKSVKDPISNYDWMVVEVDFTAHSNPATDAFNPKWVDNVAVTLTLGWGKTPPDIGLAVAATTNVMSVELNKKTAVFFFVPPEILQRGLGGPAVPLGATTAPLYYVAQFKAGDTVIEPNSHGVSTATLHDRNYIDAFLSHAQDQITKTPNGLLTANSVPFYIYSLALGVTLTNLPRAGGNLATPVNATSGH